MGNSPCVFGVRGETNSSFHITHPRRLTPPQRSSAARVRPPEPNLFFVCRHQSSAGLYSDAAPKPVHAGLGRHPLGCRSERAAVHPALPPPVSNGHDSGDMSRLNSLTCAPPKSSWYRSATHLPPRRDVAGFSVGLTQSKFTLLTACHHNGHCRYPRLGPECLSRTFSVELKLSEERHRTSSKAHNPKKRTANPETDRSDLCRQITEGFLQLAGALCHCNNAQKHHFNHRLRERYGQTPSS